MRNLIAVFVVAAGAVLSGATTAEAQVYKGWRTGAPRVFNGPGGPVSLTPGYGAVPAATIYYAPPVVAPAAPGLAPFNAPYSYYAAAPGVAPRRYVGYGDDQFPYYGRPYGHPGDRWSWQYLSGGYQGSLARYYWPPLGF